MRFLSWLEHNETLLALLGVASLLVFLGSLVLFPLIIIYLPENYFARPSARMPRTPLRLVLRMLKNAFGLLFILAGVIMLFIPGQGILAILVGVSMIDFPGKRALELRIVRHPRVRRSIDWIRDKAKRPPMVIPQESRSGPQAS